MWSHNSFFISSRSYRTLSNFGTLNDHIITEISWVVTMAPAVPSGFGRIFGRIFMCHATYLPISPQESSRFELSYRGNLQQPVEFKIVRTEK